MALIIDLDTDELQNAVQVARRANDVLTDVANLLNSIMIHTDWQCTTRDRINDNTARNRSDSLRLQSDAESLYNSINYASEQFLAAEQAIYASFDSVDSPIASFLSRTPSLVSENSGMAGLWNAAQNILQGTNGGIKKALDVVSFENIADAFQGK